MSDAAPYRGCLACGPAEPAKNPQPCGGPLLGYLAFIDDAERRHRRGERQVWCSRCGKWVWPDLVAEEHRADTLTLRQWTAMTKRLERERVRHHPSAEERYVKAVRRAARRGELGP